MQESQGGYPPPSYENALEADRLRGLRTLTHVLYALYAVHWLTGGITGLVAVIINYVKRADVAIGALATYRKGMKETSTLKVREYLAYGLPVILDHHDPDFFEPIAPEGHHALGDRLLFNYVR